MTASAISLSRFSAGSIAIPISLGVLIAVLLLCITPLAILFYRRAMQSARLLALSEEQQKLSTALDAQRIVSLRNEALLVETRERQKIEARLTYLAYHDAVTGLRNRAFLSEKLEELLQSAPPSNRYTVLLYINLDNFKSINDMLGHRSGDQLLSTIGQRIKTYIKPNDVLARTGGDEFAVLLYDMQGVDRGFRLAQRILTLIEEPMYLQGTLVNVSASAGLCAINPEYSSADIALRDVDLALQHAKREGGSRAVIYRSSMYEEAVRILQTKKDIKAAIENNEFELYYQPLMDMAGKFIYGMEALLRWNHPFQGVVCPSAFIALAEQTGDIVEIGAWCLRQACRDYEELRKFAEHNLLLSVNVSARQLELTDFVGTLRSVLSEAKIPPRYLQLEITESILVKDTLVVGAIFQEIRSLGVKIAFDDFGTGYSSLSYIERYPIDTLKIDQSFVRNMKQGPLNRDIIKMVIQLAHVIGAQVSAEGVETQEEMETLLELGCRIAQGYLFSKPVPLSAMKALLEDGIDTPRQKNRGKLVRLPARPEPVLRH